MHRKTGVILRHAQLTANFTQAPLVPNELPQTQQRLLHTRHHNLISEEKPLASITHDLKDDVSPLAGHGDCVTLGITY